MDVILQDSCNPVIEHFVIGHVFSCIYYIRETATITVYDWVMSVNIIFECVE